MKWMRADPRGWMSAISDDGRLTEPEPSPELFTRSATSDGYAQSEPGGREHNASHGDGHCSRRPADSGVDRRAVPDAGGNDEIEAEQGESLEPRALAVEDDYRGEQGREEDRAEKERAENEGQGSAADDQ
jgi:hypothetical protein